MPVQTPFDPAKALEQIKSEYLPKFDFGSFAKTMVQGLFNKNAPKAVNEKLPEAITPKSDIAKPKQPAITPVPNVQPKSTVATSPAAAKPQPTIPDLPASNAPVMAGPDIQKQLEFYATKYPTFYSDYDKLLGHPEFKQLAAALSNDKVQVTPEQLRAEIFNQRKEALANTNFMKPKNPQDPTAKDQLDPEATGRFLAATVSMQSSKDPVVKATGTELRDKLNPLQYAQDFMKQTNMPEEQRQEFYTKQNDALVLGLAKEHGAGWLAQTGLSAANTVRDVGRGVGNMLIGKNLTNKLTNVAGFNDTKEAGYEKLIEAAATETKAAKEFINQQAGQSPDYMQMLKDYWPLILAPVGLLMTLFGSGSTRALGLLAMGVGGVMGGKQVYNTYKTITSNPKMRDAIQLAVDQGKAFATDLPEVQAKFQQAFGEEAPQLLEAVKAYGMLSRVGFAEHLKNQVAHKALSEMEKSVGTPAQYWPGMAQKKLYETFPQTQPEVPPAAQTEVGAVK